MARLAFHSTALVAALGALGASRSAHAVTMGTSPPNHARPTFFPGQLTNRAATAAPPGAREQARPRLGPFQGDPTKCGEVTYCGGPVISNVELVPVFWPGVPQQTVGWASGYGTAITNSELMDMLSEYSTAGVEGVACSYQQDGGTDYAGPPMPFSTGQTITRGTAKAGVQLTSLTVATGSTIADDDATIGQEILAQITAGTLPAPTYDARGYPNTLYVVFFPDSISITLQGMASCQWFGGYHYSVPYTAQAACKGQYLPYVVVPSCGASGAQLSDVVSHELAEAVTDTDVGPTVPATANYADLAWYLGPTNSCTTGPGNCGDPTCGEIADVCVTAGDGTIPGSTVTSQEIWSQKQNGCELNDPSTPVQTAPSGTITMCMSSSTSSSSTSTSSSSSSSSSTTSSSGSTSSTSTSSSSTSTSSSSSSSGTGGSSSGTGGTGGSSNGTGGTGGDHGATSGSGDHGSGCGCSTPGTRGDGSAWLMASLLGLGLAGRTRKRRSR